MQLFGRRKIYTSLTPTIENIPQILTEAFPIHAHNAAECQELIDYTNGKHKAVLERTKEVRKGITNRIVINNAFAYTRTFTGYFLGQPIQFTAKREDDALRDAIEELNNHTAQQNKAFVDIEVYTNSCICGIAYKGTFTNLDAKSEADAPFTLVSLDPRYTFEVLSTAAGNKTVLTCTYHDSVEGGQKHHNFLVYTDAEQITYKVPYEDTGTIEVKAAHLVPYQLRDGTLVNSILHRYGRNPISAYYSNFSLIGKCELATGIMDAIDLLESNALDDVEQTVQSILTFFGVPEEQIEEIQKTETGDVLAFSGQQGINQDAKFVTCSLNSNTVSELREALYDQLKAIVGIPDRKTRGGGGGDTMGAVKLRDGWADIEVIARNDETFWRKAERNSLEVMLEILKHSGHKMFSEVSARDVEISFIRNKHDDILSKVQAGATAYNINMPLSKVAEIMDISNDNTELVKQWKENIANGGNSPQTKTEEPSAAIGANDVPKEVTEDAQPV
jgi:SPP1 family phage portal protein